ncbi:hypothetical protein CYMTET_40079 [Cymbomonas tetramitiformis]|uniref:Uncharacterized protein n=1 Tax=Cymbomonas tetramitiformis TaxID=36881 RepID=A0AAE0C8R7_9CHLO|nr:hypothetical protein CYMTET_40079 [Cymbomonas tetramitiformis]
MEAMVGYCILQLARDRDPSQEQREKFGPMCRTFFRCVLCVNTDEGLAYHMHALAAHGGEYMLYCILGRYMNEALEAHHLISWRQVGLTFRGGRPGNPFTVKLEDGTFDKSSALHEHTTQSVTKTVMQAQNRLLFPKVAHDLGTTVWEGKGYQKPEPMADLVSVFAGHAPKADLVPARQSLQRSVTAPEECAARGGDVERPRTCKSSTVASRKATQTCAIATGKC